MRYQAVFFGRLKGAIGVRYTITTEVEGTDPESARLNLYERYEHISGVNLTPIVEQTEPADDDEQPA